MSKGLLDPYRGVLKSLIITQMYGALLAGAPWVRLPVINRVVEGILGFFVSIAIDKTILGINLLYIVGETAFDLREFKNALEEYKELQGKGSTPEQLERKKNEIIRIGFDLIDLSDSRL